jgi:hypothetical protein
MTFINSSNGSIEELTSMSQFATERGIVPQTPEQTQELIRLYEEDRGAKLRRLGVSFGKAIIASERSVETVDEPEDTPLAA